MHHQKVEKKMTVVSKTAANKKSGLEIKIPQEGEYGVKTAPTTFSAALKKIRT